LALLLGLRKFYKNRASRPLFGVLGITDCRRQGQGISDGWEMTALRNESSLRKGAADLIEQPSKPPGFSWNPLAIRSAGGLQ
jgi:hypothetical protein